MGFNENLKRLRQRNNLTQDQLAEKLYISRQSISKWEQGVAEPNLETINKLTEILNCTIGDLIGGETAAHSSAPTPAQQNNYPNQAQSQAEALTEKTKFTALAKKAQPSPDAKKTSSDAEKSRQKRLADLILWLSALPLLISIVALPFIKSKFVLPMWGTNPIFYVILSALVFVLVGGLFFTYTNNKKDKTKLDFIIFYVSCLIFIISLALIALMCATSNLKVESSDYFFSLITAAISVTIMLLDTIKIIASYKLKKRDNIKLNKTNKMNNILIIINLILNLALIICGIILKSKYCIFATFLTLTLSLATLIIFKNNKKSAN